MQNNNREVEAAVNFPGDEIKTAAPGNEPCLFPIHFSYEDKNYFADVQKKKSDLTEYHVTSVSPAIAHLPDPFIIAIHFSKVKFDFPVNETYYPLNFGLTLLRSIRDGCNEVGSSFQ